MNLRPWSVETFAGSTLVLGFVAFAVGAALFWIRGGIRGGAPPTHAYFVWERGLIMAGVVLTAVGFALLDGILQDTEGRSLTRAGASAYFFGAVLVVAAEASGLAQTFEKDWFGRNYPLVVTYVVLAFLSQAAIGGSLLQSRLLAPWIGWVAIVWNMGWLVVSLLVRSAIYIPFFHHLIPLLIGLALLARSA